MPHTYKDQTVHLGPYGDPDKLNVDALTRPGELGKSFESNDRGYQIVQVDSSCVAANVAGIVATNDLAFWKDKDKYLVTNDSRSCLGHPTVDSANGAFRQFVAGVFRCAATAGYYCCVLHRGDNIPIASASTGVDVGDQVVATTGTGADVVNVASGTALTVKPIGVARSVGTGALLYTDVDIQPAP